MRAAEALSMADAGGSPCHPIVVGAATFGMRVAEESLWTAGVGALGCLRASGSLTGR